jgi:NYN domain
MNTDNKYKIVVLIDGENIPAKHYVAMEKSIHQFKHAAVKRVYGDFSNGSHAAWLGVCKEQAVEPILHLPVGIGKNGADMAITIAAMELMAARRFDTIYLVSDDCDFIPLVRRLRNEGLSVHGVGLKPATKAAAAHYESWTILKTAKAPKPTVALAVSSSNTQSIAKIAAHKIEVLKPVSIVRVAAPVKSMPSTHAAPKIDPIAAEFSKVVHAKLSEGGTTLSALGSWIRQQNPRMTPLLGPGKLKKLLIADTNFKVDGNNISLAKQEKPMNQDLLSH